MHLLLCEPEIVIHAVMTSLPLGVCPIGGTSPHATSPNRFKPARIRRFCLNNDRVVNALAFYG